MPNSRAKVGRGGINSPQDVKIAQTLLNQNAAKMAPLHLAVDEIIQPSHTANGILAVQTPGISAESANTPKQVFDIPLNNLVTCGRV